MQNSDIGAAVSADNSRSTHHRMRDRCRFAALFATVSLSMATSCSSASTNDAGANLTPSGGEEVTNGPATEAPPATVDIVYPTTWTDVPAPEGCLCGDGTPFSFQLREADPTKLLIVLSDGQFCYSGGKCMGIPRPWISDSTFWEGTGIFDFSNSENPYSDHSVVFVPNCTLDGLIGNYIADYVHAGQIWHIGHMNASSIISWATAKYPSARSVSVVGLGMGGMAAPTSSALVSALLPQADVSLVVDSSGAMPDSFAGVTSAWGFLDTFQPLPSFATLTYDTLTLTSTFELIASELPDIRIARINFAEDAFIRRDADTIGYPQFDMKQNILNGERRIESAGVSVSTWIAPGGDHVALDGQSLYDFRIGEMRLIKWLNDFLAGDDIVDHVCSVCRM